MNKFWLRQSLALLVAAIILSAARLFAQQSPETLTPDVALADGVAVVAYARVDSADLTGLRRAIERHMAAELDSDLMVLCYYEIAQRKLLDCGATSIVFTDAGESAEAFVRPGARKKSESTKTAVLECLRCVSPAMSAWGVEFADANDWLLVRPKTQAPLPAPANAEHKQNLRDGLAVLGEYPGIVVVPPAEIRERIVASLAAAKAMVPADLAAAIDGLSQIKWLALKVRLDDKPALRLIAGMPDEKSAADLAKRLPALAKAALAVADPHDKTAPPSPQLAALRIVESLQPTVKGRQITIAAGPKPTLQILDLLLVARNRMATDDLDQDTRNSYYLRDWLLTVYPCRYGQWAKSLEDIKPLFSDDPKRQQEMWTKLLMDSSGEFPRFAYHAPEQAFDPIKAPPPFYDRDPNAPRGAAILVELKDGKPRQGGFTLYENGDRVVNE